jgi:hypothetical protein
MIGRAAGAAWIFEVVFLATGTRAPPLGRRVLLLAHMDDHYAVW